MVKHYAFDNDPSCDLCAVVVDANGNYVKREDYDALAAKLAEEVRNKKQFERDWLEACDKQSAAEARLAEADQLLKEIREDAPHFGMPTVRIESYFGVTDSATVLPTGDK